MFSTNATYELLGDDNCILSKLKLLIANSKQNQHLS